MYNMTENNHSNHSLATQDLFRTMTRWQVLATLATAVIAYLLGGLHALVSVLAGGFAVVAGAHIAAAVVAKNKNSEQPSAVLVNLLKAEAIKIVVIAVLLLLVFKWYQQLVPLALIAGLASAALFSGAALAKVNKPI